MFRPPCAHHHEVEIALHNLWYHHTYRCVDTRGCVMQILFYNKFISCLYMFRAHAHHQEVKIALHSLWYHYTYRCVDTRGCVMQICFTISLFHASTCFEHMLIIRRSKLHYTASGIITPIGVMIPDDFDVLLTMHVSIFISVINQLDAQNFCFTISLFHASTRFEHMLIIRRSKLHYTASF